MSLSLTEENVNKACCQVIASAGVEVAAGDDCNVLLDRQVWVVVPESMHGDYPNRLLDCAIKICSGEPFGWTMDRGEPHINADTTFRDICEVWLMRIVWPRGT